MELLICLLALLRAVRSFFTGADRPKCPILVAVGTVTDSSIAVVVVEKELPITSLIVLIYLGIFAVKGANLRNDIVNFFVKTILRLVLKATNRLSRVFVYSQAWKDDRFSGL